MASNIYEVYDIYEKMIVNMTLDDNLVDLAINGNSNAQRKIAASFRNSFPPRKRRGLFIHFRNLEFTKKTKNRNTAVKQSFAHRTDGLSACDNPNCIDCENGHFERCRHQ